MNYYKSIVATWFAAYLAAHGAPAMALTANSLAELRALSTAGLSNTTIELAQGEYWINGGHIDNPTETMSTALTY